MGMNSATLASEIITALTEKGFAPENGSSRVEVFAQAIAGAIVTHLQKNALVTITDCNKHTGKIS